MTLPIEAWLLLAAIAALGIGAMLLCMAAAIRHGLSVIKLEARITVLRAEQHRKLIERGLVTLDDGELGEVEILPDDDDVMGGVEHMAA